MCYSVEYKVGVVNNDTKWAGLLTKFGCGQLFYFKA